MCYGVECAFGIRSTLSGMCPVCLKETENWTQKLQTHTFSRLLSYLSQLHKATLSLEKLVFVLCGVGISLCGVVNVLVIPPACFLCFSFLVFQLHAVFCPFAGTEAPTLSLKCGSLAPF